MVARSKPWRGVGVGSLFSFTALLLLQRPAAAWSRRASVCLPGGTSGKEIGGVAPAAEGWQPGGRAARRPACHRGTASTRRDWIDAGGGGEQIDLTSPAVRLTDRLAWSRRAYGYAQGFPSANRTGMR